MKSVLATACAVLIALSTGSQAQQIRLDIDETAELQGVEFGYRIDLGLRVLGVTRLEIDALLDLRDVQEKLPDLVAGQPILQLCGNDTILNSIDITARDTRIVLSGQVRSTFYQCERLDELNWTRRDEKAAFDLAVTTEVSAQLRDNCVFFEMTDLDVQLLEGADGSVEASQNLARAQRLLVEAIGLILEDTPLCPDLPPEIVALDPQYETARPQEIPEGGVGVALLGSVNTSTSTILGILKALQEEGALPGRP